MSQKEQFATSIFNSQPSPGRSDILFGFLVKDFQLDFKERSDAPSHPKGLPLFSKRIFS